MQRQTITLGAVTLLESTWVKTNMVVEMKEECWLQPILYTDVPGLAALRLGARTTYFINQYNVCYRDPTGPQLYYAGTYPGDLLRSFPQRPVENPPRQLTPSFVESAYRNAWIKTFGRNSSPSRHTCVICLTFEGSSMVLGPSRISGRVWCALLWKTDLQIAFGKHYSLLLTALSLFTNETVIAEVAIIVLLS